MDERASGFCPPPHYRTNLELSSLPLEQPATPVGEYRLHKVQFPTDAPVFKRASFRNTLPFPSSSSPSFSPCTYSSIIFCSSLLLPFSALDTPSEGDYQYGRKRC